MEDQFPLSTSKEDIGYRIKLTRKARGYTQAFAANVSKIATTAWNNYEKGIRRPRPSEVFKMTSRLHWPIGWIYEGDITQVPAALLEKIYEKIASSARKRHHPSVRDRLAVVPHPVDNKLARDVQDPQRLVRVFR